MEVNACHDKSIQFLTYSVCLLTMGSECLWALRDGSNFQLIRGPQKLSFGAFSSRRASSLTPTLDESCIDLIEVAHMHFQNPGFTEAHYFSSQAFPHPYPHPPFLSTLKQWVIIVMTVFQAAIS